MRGLLRRLSAPGGVFFVEGDVDELEQVAQAARATAVRVLADEVVRAAGAR